MDLSVAPELLESLERGALVVTGNERTARTLRRAWDQRQRGRGLERWEPAEALSWESWTRALWRSLLLSGHASALLLNPLQEQRIWREVLLADGSLQHLHDPEALATMAATGWQRLWDFRGEHRLRAAAVQGDAASFARWADGFAERCRHDDLLSAAELESELAGALGAGAVPVVEREIVLTGFAALSPARQRLLLAWEHAGGSVTPMQVAEPARVRRLVEAANDLEELRGCARWVRRVLESQPQARLAVIAADVAGERDRLESVLREVLSPELENILREKELPPWEISLGRPLDTEPMVQVALDLLRWATGPLALEKVSKLLLSRYFGGGEERQARAQLDEALRQESRLRPEVTIAELVRWCDARPQVGALLPILKKIKSIAEILVEGPRSFAEHAERVRAYLQAARWGGSTSVEFQLGDRWERVLDLFSSLDFAGETADFDEVLRTLERLARGTVFAAESRAAAVQVMGPIEAAGGRFDAMWVLRSGEADWPPRAVAHPLLPWGLQRELRMPGSSRTGEREAAQTMTKRLLASADEVVFSYARSTAEGRQQRAAAVVGELGLEEMEMDAVAPPEAAREAVALEVVEDAATLPRLENAAVQGGANVLKLQAACGFRAFAEVRLGSKPLGERELGMDAGERGNAVHAALEHFWKQVQTQERLLALTPAERAAQVSLAAEHGLRHEERRSETRWDRAYLRLQRRRLERLLEQWLKVEETRPAFEVVQQEEQRRDAVVGPLRLTVRMDRVDRVDGRQVVLDYKTGAVKTAAWLGERPDEPQVPLYALLASEAEATGGRLGAAGFGAIRAGKEMGLRGFEDGSGLLTATGTREQVMEGEDFAHQVELWRERLHRLAYEFAEGDARVRPKIYPGTCERCGQRMLCRVDAARLELGAEDDADEGEEGERG